MNSTKVKSYPVFLKALIMGLLVATVLLLVSCSSAPSPASNEAEENASSTEASPSENATDTSATDTIPTGEVQFISQAIFTVNGNNHTVSYTYDEMGNLTKLTQDQLDDVGSITYSYNDNGVLTEATIESADFNMQRIYGSPEESQAADGVTFTQPWTTNNLPQDIVGGSFSYTLSQNDSRIANVEQSTEFTGEASQSRTYTFDENGNVSTIQTSNSAGGMVTDEYSYTSTDDHGTMTVNLGDETQNWDITLDVHGKIIEAVDTKTGATLTFAYVTVDSPTDFSRAQNLFNIAEIFYGATNGVQSA